MRLLKIYIPDSIEKDDNELKMFIAAKLYEGAILSAGDAAKIVGITKRKFIESLGTYGVSVFGESIEDLGRDIKNA